MQMQDTNEKEEEEGETLNIGQRVAKIEGAFFTIVDDFKSIRDSERATSFWFRTLLVIITLFAGAFTIVNYLGVNHALEKAEGNTPIFRGTHK